MKLPKRVVNDFSNSMNNDNVNGQATSNRFRKKKIKLNPVLIVMIPILFLLSNFNFRTKQDEYLSVLYKPASVNTPEETTSESSLKTHKSSDALLRMDYDLIENDQGEIDVGKSLQIYKDNGTLLPMNSTYNCHKNGNENVRKTKFVFVHVFKTAGTTMRQLFRNYAKECHSGVAIVASCSNVSATTIDRDEDWLSMTLYASGAINTNSLKCVLKDYIHRSGKKSDESGPMRNLFLDEHMDILAGHVSLGAGYNWKEQHYSNIPAKIQYVIFFREEVDRVVSGMIYYSLYESNEGLPDSLGEYVKRCKWQIRKRKRLKGYSQVYNKYLITPQQKEHPNFVDLDIESTTKLAMKNLLELKIFVGIVEKMPQSMEMLHNLMDGDNEVKELFSPGKKILPKSGKKDGTREEITTETVSAALKSDKDFMKILMDYVKYDVAIYNFANRIHDEQYSMFQSQKKNHKSFESLER